MTEQCDMCGQQVEELAGQLDGDELCYDCWDNDTFECESCGERYHNDDLMTTTSGRSVCTDCGRCCDWCGNIEEEDDTYYCQVEMICNTCVDNTFYCEGCDERYQKI